MASRLTMLLRRPAPLVLPPRAAARAWGGSRGAIRAWGGEPIKKPDGTTEVATPLGRQTQLSDDQMELLGGYMRRAYMAVAGVGAVVLGGAALWLGRRLTRSKKAEE
mmetsp:Transcript_19146/g.57983  ORF Transcript_19146/g.57983 Transcript_19146/m.57983 type:complete len:107 (-) Transcript_19146:89-409(-)|eukprot:CAMPEP_0118871694 /NCGR_PEP_ID=MMETSP1163-20130328/14153_1 /TAXON_ID=124430 /ORGANISM="Phaeomonas parva, Strain CCMP2877" /LENGTH=106 /DNA_ID=CAMNT_0006806819 /DNA_START=125 /DNA_END=445 /DNA_ORIENTATION=-